MNTKFMMCLSTVLVSVGIIAFMCVELFSMGMIWRVASIAEVIVGLSLIISPYLQIS